MKSFIEMFSSARAISTPLVVIRTFDATSTIQRITKSLGKELAELVPLVVWDCVQGLRGLNDAGGKEVGYMCQKGDGGQAVDRGATVDLTICLAVLGNAREDVIAFINNPQLIWDTDKRAVQAAWNLRNPYKANGNMLVFTLGAGDDLPAVLVQDTLVLEEPLPTREELAKVVTDNFEFASQKYKACKNAATKDVVKAGTDALIGLPMFPADQATAQNLDMPNGKLDIETLWSRKKDIVSTNPGLTYHAGKETLSDMYGCEAWITDGKLLMDGPYSPTIIVRMDEIQRQLAGSNSDSSGTKGNLMGEFLTWVNDKNVICTLNLGVSGTSKSWGPYCLGGHYGKPVINYDVASMEDKHVGESSRHMRTAHKVLESISDGRIWLIASANSLEGLPPELISRFQKGGIYFFDLPDEKEKQGILKLKVARYGLDPKQQMPEMPNWTGRDIDNCCGRAQLYGCSLVEAAKRVIPLHQSHFQMIENMRIGASNKYLSASKVGTYQYTHTTTEQTHNNVRMEIVEGRKVR